MLNAGGKVVWAQRVLWYPFWYYLVFICFKSTWSEDSEGNEGTQLSLLWLNSGQALSGSLPVPVLPVLEVFSLPELGDCHTPLTQRIWKAVGHQDHL